MTRTAGARIGCQRPSRFWGLGCPKIYHEVEDTLDRDDRTGKQPLSRCQPDHVRLFVSAKQSALLHFFD
ncbi:hypothetical protein, partial [Thiolapillus sp.]